MSSLRIVRCHRSCFLGLLASSFNAPSCSVLLCCSSACLLVRVDVSFCNAQEETKRTKTYSLYRRQRGRRRRRRNRKKEDSPAPAQKPFPLCHKARYTSRDLRNNMDPSVFSFTPRSIYQLSRTTVYPIGFAYMRSPFVYCLLSFGWYMMGLWLCFLGDSLGIFGSIGACKDFRGYSFFFFGLVSAERVRVKALRSEFPKSFSFCSS